MNPLNIKIFKFFEIIKGLLDSKDKHKILESLKELYLERVQSVNIALILMANETKN
jgi:hypothetical protein